MTTQGSTVLLQAPIYGQIGSSYRVTKSAPPSHQDDTHERRRSYKSEKKANGIKLFFVIHHSVSMARKYYALYNLDS